MTEVSTGPEADPVEPPKPKKPRKPPVRKEISVTLVEKLPPNSLVWDTRFTGFAVRRQHGTPVYYFATRIKGTMRWLRIGPHGTWAPERARREAQRLHAEIVQGADPAAVRDSERELPTVSKAFERFMTEHVKAKRKPATVEQYDYLSRLYLLPDMGTKRIDAPNEIDIAKLHGKHAEKPYTANRLVAMTRKFFNWCEAAKLRPKGSNPCAGHEMFRESRRERFLSAEEIGQLGEALAKAEAQGEWPHAVGLFRLLILTGARLSEIQKLEWRHVDFERGLLLLPDSKTGAKAVVLPAAALLILTELPRIEGNPYVIVGRIEGQHLINEAAIWRRVRKLAGLDDLRIHDLRHSFASVAAARGGSLPIIGKLLGHTQPATTQRYAHLADSPVRSLADATADHIAAAMKPKAKNEPTAEVHDIAKARKKSAR